jgi:hypothetical protein
MTRLRSKSQLNASQQTAISKSISKDSSKSLINPLDSCPVNLKRGKEREKPKQKKPSTLKKVTTLLTSHLSSFLIESEL